EAGLVTDQRAAAQVVGVEELVELPPAQGGDDGAERRQHAVEVFLSLGLLFVGNAAGGETVALPAHGARGLRSSRQRIQRRLTSGTACKMPFEIAPRLAPQLAAGVAAEGLGIGMKFSQSSLLHLA